jgi:hypothetical protein
MGYFDGAFGINTSFKEVEHGFGNSSMQDLNDLRKALSAGYQVSSQTGGGALRVQSLESSLKVLTNTQRHYKFWQEVPKLPAYSTVEEYNVLNQYGPDTGGFNFEGVLPEQDDTQYTRQVALTKFLGTTRQVTHPLTLVRPAHGDVIALENQNGILWLLRRLENAFFYGNSTLMYNNGTGASFDGIQQQISASNVIDMLGNPLSEEVIEEAASVVAQAYGTPTHMFLGFRAMSDFSKTVYSKERFLPQQASIDANGNVGYFINSINTQFGPIGLRPDVFITTTVAEGAVSGLSPNAPVAPASIAIGSPTGSTGNFAKDGPGVYTYSAALGNNYGESAVCASQSVTITSAEIGAGNYVPLTVTNGTVGSVLPQYVSIYRSQPNGSVRYRIITTPVSSQASSGTTVVNDTDFIMAGTSEAYLGEMSTQVLAFKQLSPLMKMDLAIVAPAYRWMILLYGVLVMYAPAKWVRMVNIGTSSAVASI